MDWDYPLFWKFWNSDVLLPLVSSRVKNTWDRISKYCFVYVICFEFQCINFTIYWITWLLVRRIRTRKFCIDFKEAVVAVKTKREVLQQNNCKEFLTGLRGFRVYSNTVNWKPYKSRELLSSENTIILTTNLPLLEKLCWKSRLELLLLVMFQESYLAIFGMSFKRERNLKLKYTMQIPNCLH